MSNDTPKFEELLEEYWTAAYAEGKENRDHDNEAGDAQRTLSALQDAWGNVQAENARLREELATREALYKEQWQRAEQAEACALAAEKDAERYQGVANEWADGHLSHAVLDEVTDLDAAVDAARGELAAMGAKHEAT